jgi:hypothetical protein
MSRFWILGPEASPRDKLDWYMGFGLLIPPQGIVSLSKMARWAHGRELNVACVWPDKSILPLIYAIDVNTKNFLVVPMNHASEAGWKAAQRFADMMADENERQRLVA